MACFPAISNRTAPQPLYFFVLRLRTRMKKCLGFAVLLDITLKHAVYSLHILMYIHAKVIYCMSMKIFMKKIGFIVVVIIVIKLTLHARL